MCNVRQSLTGAQNVAGTSNKCRCENVRGLADETTFPGNADSCERVVAGDHPTGQVCRSQRKNRGRCPWLELVLKYNQSKEAQPAFSLLADSKLDGVSKGL